MRHCTLTKVHTVFVVEKRQGQKILHGLWNTCEIHEEMTRQFGCDTVQEHFEFPSPTHNFQENWAGKVIIEFKTV